MVGVGSQGEQNREAGEGPATAASDEVPQAHTEQPETDEGGQPIGHGAVAEDSAGGARCKIVQRRIGVHAAAQHRPQGGQGRLAGDAHREDLVVPEQLVLGQRTGRREIDQRKSGQQDERVALDELGSPLGETTVAVAALCGMKDSVLSARGQQNRRRGPC